MTRIVTRLAVSLSRGIIRRSRPRPPFEHYRRELRASLPSGVMLRRIESSRVLRDTVRSLKNDVIIGVSSLATISCKLITFIIIKVTTVRPGEIISEAVIRRRFTSSSCLFVYIYWYVDYARSTDFISMR